jgi:hypothetical protein
VDPATKTYTLTLSNEEALAVYKLLGELEGRRLRERHAQMVMRLAEKTRAWGLSPLEVITAEAPLDFHEQRNIPLFAEEVAKNRSASQQPEDSDHEHVGVARARLIVE